MAAAGTNVDETIREAQLRARGYWYEDGAVDIGVALVFLALAALFTFEASLAEGSALRGISAFGLPVVSLGGYFLSRRVVHGIKNRFTHPRTGLVDYPKPGPSHRRASFVVALLTGFVVAFAVSQADIDSWIPFLQGISIGAFLLFLARQSRIGRYTFAATCSIALGILISFLGLDSIAGTAAYFGGLGLVLLLTGLLALRAYLALAPEPLDAVEIEPADASAARS
jgi:hypothetical protein